MCRNSIDRPGLRTLGKREKSEIFLHDPIGLPLVGGAFSSGDIYRRAGFAFGGDFQGVPGLGLPFFHQLDQLLGFIGVLGEADQVGLFVWIGLEVEELHVADFGVGDEFPAFIADGALDLEEREEY